jgi:lipopolysaccharide/colanic/teichoic acid biosynthesis glycosyltransferase
VVDGSPVFYFGDRSGQNFKIFRIIKFRTMKVGSGREIAGDTVSSNDSRVTKLGFFLRKYKIDELPQLLLVLLGKMSIVGPRPELPIYVDKKYYSESAIDLLKPGITDFSSIYFRELSEMIPSANTNSYVEQKVLPRKNRLRRFYAQKMSFSVDLHIICKTISRVFL